MVAYIRSDLEFILSQIKVAERHADGESLVDIFNDPDNNPATNDSIPIDRSIGLRTVDGSYNNLLPGREQWGSAGQEFPTLLDPSFREIMVPNPGPGPALLPVSYAPGVDNDGPGQAGPGDVFDPFVRTISNLIVDQTLSNPAAIMVVLDRLGVPSVDQLDSALQIKAAFDPIEGLFLAVDEATDASAEAAAAAAANPGDQALQDAADAAAADLAAAEATLEAANNALDSLLAQYGIELDGANLSIPNVAPDEGLSASFNSWFTLFGQFFDHGLDLVNKGGSGTVMIPLMPDDPLFDPAPGALNFMVLTRATISPGGDGILGTADDVRPVNLTTSFVDQNQTYTSHPSHQVFLREYVFSFDSNGDGVLDSRPVPTGNLLHGANGGLATWGEVKAQAADLLGIQLFDAQVGNVPLLFTDAYGNFIPGPIGGFPQIVMQGNILVEGNPAANGGAGVASVILDVSGAIVGGAIGTGHAFLADIAHNAVPTGIADGDIEIGLGNPDNSPTDGQYDNELLDAHFTAGDGRANENVGLTAVHHVFHSEHNRLVQHTKDVVVADALAMLAGGATPADAVAFLNEWLAVDVTTIAAGATVNDFVWDGARLFQAAKFGTEMEYQHLVFEEFARKIQPQIDGFIVPQGYEVDIDPSIVAEFAHVVYRFGHSMLTENIDRFDPQFNEDAIGLIEGFLNPLQFENGGTDSAVHANIAAGDIIRGMTRQVGNEIDEFVTSALRNNLLGLPLDLATINLARGRDTGVPSLNAARAEFFEATNGNSLLAPYTSWTDFALHLKNEASIINFIAAYGTHSLITSQSTIEGKRNAALTLLTGESFGGLTVQADAVDFLNATGDYAGGALGGLNDVDLWIGGLAEEIMPFGGMLGSTFNFVFETSLEKLQNGDRFYYLQRLDGLHLFGEMEGNSFAAMMMRNSDAIHLPSDVFSTPGLILEVDRRLQYNPGLGEEAGADGILADDPNTDADESVDNLGIDPISGSIFGTPLVIRNNPATPGADTNYLRYTGDDHVVLGGTNPGNSFNLSGNDILIASIGDDTLYGDGGADRLEGGFGNDIINGGDGDDIITDAGGDDNIKAQGGNDFVNAGPGLDLVMGGEGNDFIVLGTDAGSEVFGGTGNDYVLGATGTERILGNEGDDWIEHGTFDGAPGDNFDEINALDLVVGHDVFVGAATVDEFIGEGGDDIMVGSAGVNKNVGMSGFDWVTYKDSPAVDVDLTLAPPAAGAIAEGDSFSEVEGLSGSASADTLRGSIIDQATIVDQGAQGSRLTNAGVLRIAGLAELLGLDPALLALNPNGIAFDTGDIILGGDGSDTIEGRAGDDIIDGDRWLDVRIGVYNEVAADGSGGTGGLISTHASMTELIDEITSGAINPGQLRIVRTIQDSPGTGLDTAVFSGDFADYDIVDVATGDVLEQDDLETNQYGQLRITGPDGSDLVSNIERLQFDDITVEMVPNAPPVVDPTDAFSLPEDSAPFVRAIGASDPNLDSLTYSILSGAEPSLGTVTLLGDNFTYTPFANANGGDTFTILVTDAFGASAQKVVTVTITPSNDVPAAPASRNVATAEDTATAATAIGAIELDGETLTYTVAPTGQPAKGAVTFDQAAGTFVYTPTANANGADTFVIEISDGVGPSTQQVVSVNIAPANDVPAAPASRNVATAEDTATAATAIGAIELDGETLTYTVAPTGQPAKGAVTFDQAAGTFVYMPTANANGADTFVIEISDGVGPSTEQVVSVNIAPVNDTPVVTGPVSLGTIGENSGRLIRRAELLANASDVDGQILNVAGLTIAAGNGSLTNNGNGTWNYTPLTDDQSEVTFAYQVTDGTASVATTASLDIELGELVIPGTPGDDSFQASLGNSRINAGTGVDTVQFGFRLVDATFTWSGNQVIIDTASSHTVLTGVERFEFTDGNVNNSDGTPLIDDLYYYASNRDVWVAHVDADQHYNAMGWKEGRDPSAFFDTTFYLALNQDVKAAGVNPLDHFHSYGWQEGRLPSPDFDADAYRANYPDVAAANVDPLEHLLLHGAQEGRQPTAAGPLLGPNGFDYVYYLENNPDVAAAAIDPLEHFNNYGWTEGRNPNAFFDTSAYLANYSDVAQAGINPLDHFNNHGWTEGRNPNAFFDTSAYLANYPDVAAAGINPLIHFLLHGIAENRSPFGDGVWG